MKVIGKQITAVICQKCGALLQVEKEDYTERKHEGYTRRYTDCCNCGTKIIIDSRQVHGIYQLDNPSDYIQISR